MGMNSWDPNLLGAASMGGMNGATGGVGNVGNMGAVGATGANMSSEVSSEDTGTATNVGNSSGDTPMADGESIS